MLPLPFLFKRKVINIDEKLESGIYKIINLVDGKIYIGSSFNLKIREYNHFKLLDKNKHTNIHLQRAYNKYKKCNFKFEVIEVLENAPKDKKELRNILLMREQYWIDNLKPFGEKGYNFLPTAGSNLGITFSDESKRKMSLSRSGKNHWTTNKSFSKEARMKMSESHKINIPILQLDLNGNIVNTWNSIHQASEILGIDRIRIWDCLNKRTKTHGGYIWIYEEEYTNFGINLKDYKQNVTKSIIQFDLNYNIINKFSSIAEAEKELGINNSMIVRVCKKQRNHTHGFIFMYEEEYDVLIEQYS